MCSFDLESLIDSPTCYKSIKPTCTDLIRTNKKNHFMKSVTCDHHKLITTILRKTKNVILKKCFTEITRDSTKRNLKLSWNLKLVSAIFYQFFIFSPNDSPLETEKCFLFHLRSSFRSPDIQIFVIFFLPLHSFKIQKGKWSGIIYDVINWLA